TPRQRAGGRAPIAAERRSPTFVQQRIQEFFIMLPNANSSITDPLRALLCASLDEMLVLPSGRKTTIACFERLRRLLEALPLDTAEFALAVNRLTNARHYLQVGEHGAARYELHLLRRNLKP